MMKYIYKNYLKRTIDFILGITLAFILLPIFLLISVVIFIKMGRPILFIQDRGGYQNSVFKLYKFRTMSNNLDENNELLPPNKRITKIGNFLRKTSLDEIPSLINVIFGQMSFIGPRPFIKEYLNNYSSIQKKRHLVRPGITGLAQINGRNNLSWNEKFKYDLYYVKKVTIFMDIKILLMTFIVVLTQKNVSENDESFKGFTRIR